MEPAVWVPGIPFPLRWHEPAVDWSLDERGDLTIDAGPRTDLFLDPGDSDGTARIRTAPRLVGAPDGDWMLCARVTVGMRATFDAGVLLAWVDDDHWAKLCLERSPKNEPTIVSVVSRDTSDDANGWTVPTPSAWLRIARTGPSIAFHASSDGAAWQFVRHFSLGAGASPMVGFVAQSPTGDGCRATFDRIRFEARRLGDLRNGA